MSFDISLALQTVPGSMNSVPILFALAGRILRSVRLTRKLADSLNGFNLSRIGVGDTVELPDQTADMLIAERWAESLTKGPRPQAKDGSTRSRSSRVPKRK